MVFIFLVILIVILGALSWIDFKSFRLPNVLTFPLIGAGFLSAHVLPLTLQNSVIGALAGYFAFVAIELGFKYLRGKNGLGRGDAKLLAAGGAWCGWAGLPLIVLIASALGIVAVILTSPQKKTASGHIPFGPFLSFGIFSVWCAMQWSGYFG